MSKFFSDPIEEISQGFARNMKAKIYADNDSSNPYCILDLNTFDVGSKSVVPVRYWNYDSLLLLHRLLDKCLERMSYWYFNEKQLRGANRHDYEDSEDWASLNNSTPPSGTGGK